VAALGPLLARHGTPAFKLASDAYGLLRPDKCVIFVDEATDAGGLVADLHRALSGCAAQGVPFTASLDGTALLTWGVDRKARVDGRGAESWRARLTTALGAAIAAGRTRGLPAAGIPAFACRYLDTLDVDTARWAPRAGLIARLREGAA
jgi:hypothetical protein